MVRFLSITFGILLPQSVSAEAPSFLNEVMPVMTRMGCNQGACHGKGAGQNGFRLSLRGYAPDQDWKSIVREFDGRRLDRTDPERSLLLLKAAGISPHEGGKILEPNSREYQTLLNWIRAGAPEANKNDPKLTKLRLEPGKQILKVDQAIQIKAIGEFSDGSSRDVTWLTKFESNDAGMIPVTPEGKVKALRQGESAIRAAFLSEVAVAIFTVPFESNTPSEIYANRANFVDNHVLNKLKDLKIEPSGMTDDSEFIRRVYLDAIGTLPRPEEVKAFLADKAIDKRARLIDGLLERPEFTDYWTLFLNDLFQNRKERDHDVRGTKGVRAFHTWLRNQVAANRPWDQIVRDILTSQGSSDETPGIGYYIVTIGEHQEAEKSEVIASVAQAFLGTRIGCAQCHNHPLEKYTQDDYYHFAAFFSRVKFERKEPKSGPTILRISHRDPNQNKNPIGTIQPRTGAFLLPRPLDRSEPQISPRDDPRVKLVDWMVDPKNEYFAGAIINRIWKHYLGVGIVEPVDDLRATNPPTNPDLWNALIREFTTHRYDLKHLMRVILNSQTYQRSSATRPGNRTDTRFYSHYQVRRLPAEVMLDAVNECVGFPSRFEGYPVGMRAIQVPDPGVNSYFLSIFGRSGRVTACACERMGEVTMPQLLHLQNSGEMVNLMRNADGRLMKWLKQYPDDQQLTDALFWLTLSRPAKMSEIEAIRRQLSIAEKPAEMRPEQYREEVFRDLFWALLNAKDFAFNH
jgi:hypothetical protein